MALYMGVHNMEGGASEDVVNQNWNAYKSACSELGCEPKHAHFSTEHGKAFCITEAASADDVQKAHEHAKVPVDEILEVKDLT